MVMLFKLVVLNYNSGQLKYDQTQESLSQQYGYCVITWTANGPSAALCAKNLHRLSCWCKRVLSTYISV